MVVGGGLGVGNNNILLLRLRWKELCLQLSHQIRLLARSSLLLLSKYQFICWYHWPPSPSQRPRLLYLADLVTALLMVLTRDNWHWDCDNKHGHTQVHTELRHPGHAVINNRPPVRWPLMAPPRPWGAGGGAPGHDVITTSQCVVITEDRRRQSVVSAGTSGDQEPLTLCCDLSSPASARQSQASVARPGLPRPPVPGSGSGDSGTLSPTLTTINNK